MGVISKKDLAKGGATVKVRTRRAGEGRGWAVPLIARHLPQPTLQLLLLAALGPPALPFPLPLPPSNPHHFACVCVRQDLMTSPAISLKASGQVADAAVCMTEHKFHR